MSTQSPATGCSSTSNPRSTRRRTPFTSTIASVGWSARTSTILPGIARHIGNRCNYVKGAFELIFHFYCASGGGDELYAVVALTDREFTVRPQCGRIDHGAGVN